MEVTVNKLSYSYESEMILKEIDLNIPSGSFVGIIGPNGSGKSTLLKNIYRALSPTQGVILINDEQLNQMSYKTSAKLMAVVGQENDTPFDFTVLEVVKMGRMPYKKLFELDTKEDTLKAMNALKQVGLEDYANQFFSKLSGGQKQRVLVARALCQDTQILILDEPTNHLDVYYQMQILEIVKGLNITVISAIHDLNMAAMFCDYLYVLKDGKIYDSGNVEMVLTTQMILDVFRVSVSIIEHPLTHCKQVIFLPNKMEEGI